MFQGCPKLELRLLTLLSQESAQGKLPDDGDDEKDVYRTIMRRGITADIQSSLVYKLPLQMKFFATLSLAALVAAVQAQVTINTPSNLVQCQPVQLTWTGGQSPYF
ncbi:hypothetical protein MPER_09249, partial [Moniliophthora perniciosa FA553]